MAAKRWLEQDTERCEDIKATTKGLDSSTINFAEWTYCLSGQGAYHYDIKSDCNCDVSSSIVLWKCRSDAAKRYRSCQGEYHSVEAEEDGRSQDT